MDMHTHWLFADMNSYFASVEQQLRPELRGRPVGVVPMMADTTCCLAASYEAKAFGVKTGTKVAEAKELCPEIVLVKSRTREYVRLHKKIVRAVESVVPVHQVHSIDEMSCQLKGDQCREQHALQLGRQVKQAIKKQVGEAMLCSIGLAPNRILAKVASNLQKPDGLSLLRKQDLPHALYGLDLRDLPGVGSRMVKRFQRQGIFSIRDLCERSAGDLHEAWGGVVGDRWWHILRGEDLAERPTHKRTIGHQHVLPPDLRNDQSAYEVLVKLTSKAGRRLREINYWAGLLTLHVRFLGQADWSVSKKLGAVQDTPTFLHTLSELWSQRPSTGIPFRVSVTLSELKSSQACSLPLFPEQQRRQKVAKAMDAINQRMGDGALYLAAMHHSRDAAPDRIAFQSIPDERRIHESAKKS